MMNDDEAVEALSKKLDELEKSDPKEYAAFLSEFEEFQKGMENDLENLLKKDQ